jgi:two-component system nitrogen regulation sensor histidine kinase GlnL
MGKLKKITPKWEEIFASLGDGLVILDTGERLIGINPAAERLTGFSAESVLGHPLEEAFSENSEVLKMLAPSFREGRTTTLREVPWHGKREEKAIVDLSATPHLDEEGELAGWILVFRDITPIKNLEEEVRKGDRLAMMGTIAAGLAHEIKNPLGGIKGAAQLLAREKLSPASAECLGIIVKEVERVDRIVSQLLTFSRPKSLSVGPVNLNELLDSIVRLQREPLERRKIRLVREFDPSLPPVLGDGDQLYQVFLNFIKNAMEAIPDGGGEIRIKSRLMTNFKIKEGEGRKPVPMVLAEIRDNGAGISKEDLGKIFTPFFTTKEKGTGLGLAIAQRVVSEHGGIIRVQSDKEHGTCMQIYLRSCS